VLPCWAGPGYHVLASRCHDVVCCDFYGTVMLLLSLLVAED
jgi:hypothetical protein